LCLINKIEFLEDQTYFLQSQLIQIRDQNVRKSNFLGQLMAKLKKFTIKDHFAKDIKLWGPNWLKSGVKLKRIKKFNGQLRVNLYNSKTND